MFQENRKNMDDDIYDSDPYTWALTQADLLRNGRYSELDMENLIEEVEEIGNNKRDALNSQIVRLLQHLLKWQYQPTHIGRSWSLTIGNARIEIEQILNRNPGLKGKLDSVYESSWEYAVKKASLETDIAIKVFPAKNPWEFEEIMDMDFWPEAKI